MIHHVEELYMVCVYMLHCVFECAGEHVHMCVCVCVCVRVCVSVHVYESLFACVCTVYVRKSIYKVMLQYTYMYVCNVLQVTRDN